MGHDDDDMTLLTRKFKFFLKFKAVVERGEKKTEKP